MAPSSIFQKHLGSAASARKEIQFLALVSLIYGRQYCEFYVLIVCHYELYWHRVSQANACRVKPLDVDELQWREALQRAGGPENPDRLWPVPAKGFKDLIARKTAQVP